MTMPSDPLALLRSRSYVALLVIAAIIGAPVSAVAYFFLALVAIQFFAVDVHIFPISSGYTLGVTPGWNLPFIESAVYHSLLLGFWLAGKSLYLLVT